MRRKNLRVATVGTVLFVMAIAFYVFMLSIASRSHDPAELLRTVGMVSGAVGGLAAAMVAIGLIGTKANAATARKGSV